MTRPGYVCHCQKADRTVDPREFIARRVANCSPFRGLTRPIERVSFSRSAGRSRSFYTRWAFSNWIVVCDSSSSTLCLQRPACADCQDQAWDQSKISDRITMRCVTSSWFGERNISEEKKRKEELFSRSAVNGFYILDFYNLGHMCGQLIYILWESYFYSLNCYKNKCAIFTKFVRNQKINPNCHNASKK